MQYLIGTGDDIWEIAFSFCLALDNGLDDARMVGPEIDEAMGDTGLPEGVKEAERGGVGHPAAPLV